MMKKEKVSYRQWLAAALLLSLAGPAAAQLAGHSYESIAALPDFGGLWEVQRGSALGYTPPSLRPEYAARAAAYAAEDTPAANCVPPGMPVIMTQPYPLEFLFTPGKVTIMLEVYSQWRQIFTDGRALPEDPDLTYNGHSIGSWEDETLVVETVGVSTDTPLARDYGIRHSEQMRVYERYRLIDDDTLELELTVYDNEALTEPWTNLYHYTRHRDWTLTEFICQQNNRNFTTDDGKAGVSLD